LGRAASITFAAPGAAPAITATLRVDSPYDKLVRADATVGLETQGVLGDKFVSLAPGDAKKPLAPGATIKTREDQGLAQVVAKSSDIIDSVASTTKKIDDFAAGLPEAAVLKAMITDLTASARSLKLMVHQLEGDETVVGLLRDPDSASALKSGLAAFSAAAARVESITRKIDEGQGTLGALVNDRALYEDLRGILGQKDRGAVARRAFQQATGAPDAEK
jgi:phospholipid/cholesterol/gamma-HCH transport system substrate-binding protein